MLVREAEKFDLNAIRLIINHEIKHSTVVYEYDDRTEAQVLAWFEDKKAKGRPVLVIEDQGVVIGYGTYDQFRPKIAYQYSMEHSIYIHPELRSKGAGELLMNELIAWARKQNIHTLIGGIDASNEGSLRFHKRMGFEEIGRCREVGYKFDRWLDLIFMQKILN